MLASLPLKAATQYLRVFFVNSLHFFIKTRWRGVMFVSLPLEDAVAIGRAGRFGNLTV